MSTESDTTSQHDADPTVSATTTRTVAHALFRYWRSDLHGRRHLAVAVRGDVIEVSPADLEIGERHGALVDGELPTPAAPVPAGPVTPEVAGGSDPAETAPSATGLDVDPSVAVAPEHQTPPRPRTVAKRDAWEEYAVARGMGREEAENLTKDELIERFPPD